MTSGNFVSEWFGHRMFPTVVSSDQSLGEQRAGHCPFLTIAKGTATGCIKADTSKGVCTINSASNGPRQDWVVCPYRVFDPKLMRQVVTRLYGLHPEVDVRMVAAPTLSDESVRDTIEEAIDAGTPVLVYFDQKMGGEIQIGPTDRSPQISFDTTFVQLNRVDGRLALGQFAVLEIQTMDFHGSYRFAVQNLRDALRLHTDTFPMQVHANQGWLSDSIEGPNIANVFKRTFWQLMFKFEIALSPKCAGAALAIPEAVWDSWQKFLGSPELQAIDESAEHYALDHEDPGVHDPLRSWIYVFDFDLEASVTPSPMRLKKLVQTSTQALAHHALEEAPKGAIAELERSLYPTIARRLNAFWPVDFHVDPEEAGAVEIVEDDRPIEEAELDA